MKALTLSGLVLWSLVSLSIGCFAQSGIITTYAGNGTADYGGDGGLATAAQLNHPFGVAAAVGGGYSTLFPVTNTGEDESSGSLILTDQQANPLTVSVVLTDSSGITEDASTGSDLPFMVPAGGTILLTAAASTPDGPVEAGWARLISVGGSLSAVASYESVAGTVLQTLVGVLQSQPLRYATIPVDNNSPQSKQTGYAIANPGRQSISVRLALVAQDGSVLDDSITVTLGPGQQIARFVYQDVSRADFRGSMVLRGQTGATFIAVALVEKQSLWTAIPLISGKSPRVPD